MYRMFFNLQAVRSLWHSSTYCALILAGCSLVAGAAAKAHGQNSSLYAQDVEVAEIGLTTLENSSWLYRPPLPPRQIRINDIVMIEVFVRSEAAAEGEFTGRRNISYDAILKEWLQWDGFGVTPAPQRNGDPRVNGSENTTYRTQAEVETREELNFQIAAYVVDIRPNGNLVLEAHQVVRSNEDTWEYSLTGVCRPDDINPDNSVLSRNVAELHVEKTERGHVYDGYRRGWFTRWFQTFRPF